MPRSLSYADAVRILGGTGPLAKTVDSVLPALGLPDVVKLGSQIESTINESLRGLGRHERSERLQAAHAVLVVTAFFETFEECLAAAAVESPGFDHLRFVRAGEDGSIVRRILSASVPLPAPDLPYQELLERLATWFSEATADLMTKLADSRAWDRADDNARYVTERLLGRLPEAAVARYDQAHRRLAEEIPEFAIWADRLEARATTHGLERLEAVLLRATAGRDPGRHRDALARAYRAELARPVLGGDAGELMLPALRAAYLDPIFRVRSAGPGAHPADDQWWAGAETRHDISGFLAAYLTSPEATEAPLLLLGQPGAGKSSLTRILAARLPASDFFVCRVALREVPAEAEIQDQIELALRTAIGETVSWAELSRDAGGALPVVLLDGFDELLQATGLHQSDYLQRVAAFQQREASLGRPVAVMVTSRIAVADRARLPAGALAVRLEPFDDAQIERWLTVWNDTNPLVKPLPAAVVRRFHQLAEQPLLLLMLALYDGTSQQLQDTGADLDGGRLYERLLASFAAREVRRLHAGQPDSAVPALVEQELLRLSVVAFAMFHRLRLWVTERELDDDLAGLGLAPSRPGRADNFRTPLTAGQEMVGRFFFIQRAQAIRDDRTLQTYEFLHATFGEYLVARLVVQAVRDTEARESASTLALRLGPSHDDDLLRSLLGFTPLTARGTIVPFVADLLDGPDRDRLRAWLVRRTSQALTHPSYGESSYRPVDKRADHWMATYSFNLLLLTLACGGELRASDLFTRAEDPAYWLRGAALQWRAAVPGGMFMDAMEIVTVAREWHEGRRDIVLRLAVPWTGARPGPMDVSWFNDLRPGVEPAPVWRPKFEWRAALTSMHLSNHLSDNTLLHTLEPLLDRMPEALLTFVHHAGADESLARSLIELWLASAFEESPEALLARYERVAAALAAIGSGDDQRTSESRATATLLMQALRADADRLPPDRVVALIGPLAASRRLTSPRGAELALRCLLTPRVAALPSAVAPMGMLLSDHLETLDDALLAQALHTLARAAEPGDTKIRDLVQRLDGRRATALETLDPDLGVRLAAFR
ncbi:NACHT domain-containing protein [Actinoplanes sp. URMC 104]|uniref:NACHT domain-containing protein n=1 Tax=Actinoplanes sp. URMC 104 TaxID=3423409 RepID=UPI003F1B66F9